MPNFVPLHLTHNPFDPNRVDPNDLVTIPIGVKLGLNNLNAKFQVYVKQFQQMSPPQLQNHALIILGPHMSGRSSFCNLASQKLRQRLQDSGVDPQDVFLFESSPPLALGDNKGPNESLRDIFRGLLNKMQDDPQNRFAAVPFKEAKKALLDAKRLNDICNAFLWHLEDPLRKLSSPKIFVFDNLNSADVYTQIFRALSNISSIRIVSAFWDSDVRKHLQAVHADDKHAFFVVLESLEFTDVLALVQHNLRRARNGHPDGLFPFEGGAISKFFEAPNAKLQPFGRIIKACFRSLELKAVELEINPLKLDLPINHDYMLKAYEQG
jgi:hypothetical protein